MYLPTGLSESQAARWFWLFAAVHVLVWTAVPALVNPNLPLDAIEKLSWGLQWQWGYDKHPPLSAWLAEAAAILGGRHDVALYLLSQLCVVTGFWAIWRLARSIMDPTSALVAVLLMEGILYHQYTSPEFNVNVLQLPLWGLGFWWFWQAVQSGKIIWWLGVGVAAGLGLLTKYLAVFMLLPMFLFCLWTAEGRAQWRRPGPYLAAGLALAVTAPHAWWALQHEFTTIQYALSRAGAVESNWLAHVLGPLKFAGAQAVAGLFMLLMAWVVLAKLPLRQAKNPLAQRWFWLAAVSPVAGMMLLSALTGFSLRSMWGTPMLIAWTLPLVYRHEVRALVSGDRWKRALTICGALALIPVLVYAGQATLAPYTDRVKRVHFPGSQLAAAIEARHLSRTQGDDLSIVIGDEWLGGNLGWYASSRPSVYVYAQSRHSPWMDDEQVRRHGAVVVWWVGREGAKNDQQEPQWLTELRLRFPDLAMDEPIVLNYQTSARVPAAVIGVAWISPDR